MYISELVHVAMLMPPCRLFQSASAQETASEVLCFVLRAAFSPAVLSVRRPRRKEQAGALKLEIEIMKMLDHPGTRLSLRKALRC